MIPVEQTLVSQEQEFELEPAPVGPGILRSLISGRDPLSLPWLGLGPQSQHTWSQAPAEQGVQSTAHPTEGRPVRRYRLVSSRDRTREMRWLAENRHKYAGCWVALDGDRLVAYGATAGEFFAAVDRSGVKEPLLAHLEPADDLSFGGW